MRLVLLARLVPLIVTMVLGSGGALAVPTAPAASLEPRQELEEVVAELRSGGPPGAMGLYARAFAGYALINEARAEPAYAPRAAPLLDALVERILAEESARPFRAGFVTAGGRRLSASVAQRGHLALLLVGLRGLAPLPPQREQLLRELARGLAADAAAAPRHLLASYGRRVYPADNEVAAAALALLQAQRRDDAVAPGLAALQGALGRLDEEGLPPAEIAGPARGALSRGCALSWTVAMRGLYDPPRARSLYARYRAAFFESFGPFVGFREWPRGVEGSADSDSGPIIRGIGTAASGIGIGAARLAGAEEDHQALLTSARFAGMGILEGRRGAHQLERAMALWARSARPWL